MSKIDISYILFGNHSGYGQAGQDLVSALHKNGNFNIHVDLIENQITKPGVSDERFSLLKQFSKNNVTDDFIQIFHCVPPTQSKFDRKKRSMGFATFETYDPPSYGGMNWVKILNNNDAVIVPSKFNYNIFAHTALEKPIFHIPHCINTHIYNGEVEPLENRDKFTFLFFGSWKQRKGYPELIEAWFSEFDSKDDVQLLIKTDKPKQAIPQVNRLKNNLGYKNKDTAPILFEDKVVDENDLPAFLKSVDCFVSPTRGEGFGLPGLQCMSVGVPVIITDFSGCQDYANSETATLLKPRGFVMHEALDKYPQFRKRKWPFIAVEDIKKTMRDVLTDYAGALDRARRGAKFVEENFNYDKVGNMFLDMVNTVYA